MDFLQPQNRVTINSELIDKIVELYIAGNSLRDISEMPGLPTYSALLYNITQKPEFARKMRESRLVRAIYHEEKALEAATSAQDKDDVPAARLRYDAHVWAATVNNPGQYGKKNIIAADQDMPLQVVIRTGVPDIVTESVTLDATGIAVASSRVVESSSDGSTKTDSSSSSEIIDAEYTSV